MKTGQTAPRTVSRGLRQHAWWVMRRRIVFTLPELLATLADGSERDASSNLGKYLRALEKAGIIWRQAHRQSGSTPTSNGHIISYRLVVNEGRKAPVWRVKACEVYDPNTDIAHAMQAKEVSDE